jgi:hypothetical protein
LVHILNSHPLTDGPVGDCSGIDFPGYPYNPVSNDVKEEVQAHLYDWFNAQPPHPKNRYEVSKCGSVDDLIFRARYVEPTNAPKFFMLFRDPADWVWAVWNFWTDHSLDAHEVATTSWAGGNQYRSPELFHELVVAGDQIQASIQKYRDQTIVDPRKLVAAFGRKQVFFAKSEDMKPEVMGAHNDLLERLQPFINLVGFDGEHLKSIHNCQESRGLDGTCEETEKKWGAYQVDGNRNMLPETRKFLYLQFQQECEIWKREFGVIYEDCLNA